VIARLSAAESEVARIQAQQQRVERDYLAEELGAAAFERLSSTLAEDHSAAVAERDRLAGRGDQIRAARESVDAESETLSRLAALRDSIAANARDAADRGDVAALRAVTEMAFDHVSLAEDGTIAGLTPGVRMEISEQAFPLLVMDDEILPGVGAGDDAPFRVDEAGHVKPDLARRPLPHSR
jgi:hypothetical protein